MSDIESVFLHQGFSKRIDGVLTYYGKNVKDHEIIVAAFDADGIEPYYLPEEGRKCMVSIRKPDGEIVEIDNGIHDGPIRALLRALAYDGHLRGEW